MALPMRRRGRFRTSALVLDAVGLLFDLALLPALVLVAGVARLLPRRYDVGLGPDPINSHAPHKRALERNGYRAVTFVTHLDHITAEFDLVCTLPGPLRYLSRHLLFAWVATHVRALLLPFSGGPLGSTRLLWRFEPALLALAGVRVLMLPYGGDVQDMTRSPNLLFKHAMGRDYPSRRDLRPTIASRIDLWSGWADHVVAGCDWVDYLHQWDSLLLLHFPVDTDRFRPAPSTVASERRRGRPVRVLHAPNHVHLKGTRWFEEAVDTLSAEGIEIELEILQGVSNDQVRRAIHEADVVADQLVIGWYAMFALEAMASGKPVLCAVRPDLEALHVAAGTLDPGELPLVRCTPDDVSQRLRELVLDPARRREIGVRSREFVLRRHSLDVIGQALAGMLRQTGVNGKGGEPNS